MTKSLALDPHDLSSRGDLLPSRAGIPPRVASIIWNRNFPSLLSDPSTQGEICMGLGTSQEPAAARPRLSQLVGPHGQLLCSWLWDCGLSAVIERGARAEE